MQQSNLYPLKLMFDEKLESQLLPLGLYYKIDLINMSYSIRLKQADFNSTVVTKVDLVNYNYRDIESPLNYAKRMVQENFDLFISNLLETQYE